MTHATIGNGSTVDRAATDNATHLGAMVRLAIACADRAVVADLEQLPVEPSGSLVVTWRDTRPLLNEWEQPPECIDMARQMLDYADLRRLIARHPQHHHLVRITRLPQ